MGGREHRCRRVGAAIDMIARYQRIGTTVMNAQFQHESLQHLLDQLDTFMIKVAPRFAD